MVERRSRKRQELPQGISQRIAEIVLKLEERTPEPIAPIEISEQDKEFLSKHIGTESKKHGDYYVRTVVQGQPWQAELWHLASYCLGAEREIKR